ncbi:MAG: hypothetical protein JW738_00895 [Actinobacteria bacterium]|nr:hypothetical protein [Actinomycetota bacterium]
MCVHKVNNKGLTALFILLVFTLIGAACYVIETPVSSADNNVDFHLKVIEEEKPTLEVTLEFNIEKDQEVALIPMGDSAIWRPEIPSTLGPSLTAAQLPISITSFSEDNMELQTLQTPETGWLIKGLTAGTARVIYRWQPSEDTIDDSSGYPGSKRQGFPIIKSDIKIIDASEALMCPISYPEQKYVSEDYSITVEIEDDERLFVPWKLNEEGDGFSVEGTDALLENYISWGVIDEVSVRNEGPEIIAGFSTDYDSLTDADKESYAANLGSLYSDLLKTLGPQSNWERVTIVLCGAKRFSLDDPDWATLQNSSVIFHGGKELKGEPSVAAAGALFDLWNGFSFKPAANGDALWFMEGMSVYYPLHAANAAGLLNSNAAFDLLSGIYVDYVDDPASRQESIQEAEKTGSNGLPCSAAVLCSSIDMRLLKETKGEKDISWLAGEIADNFKHSEGKDYGLSDIVKILDSGTGDGWRKFLSKRVVEKHLFLASEFAECGLFKGKSSVQPKGSNSTRNWILLGAAIIFILLIPVFLSSYVRKAVKLDIKMPKIFPDDDWDDDEGKPAEDKTDDD